jgi:hypothetical protein
MNRQKIIISVLVFALITSGIFLARSVFLSRVDTDSPEGDSSSSLSSTLGTEPPIIQADRSSSIDPDVSDTFQFVTTASGRGLIILLGEEIQSAIVNGENIELTAGSSGHVGILRTFLYADSVLPSFETALADVLINECYHFELVDTIAFADREVFTNTFTRDCGEGDVEYIGFVLPINENTTLGEEGEYLIIVTIESYVQAMEDIARSLEYTD